MFEFDENEITECNLLIKFIYNNHFFALASFTAVGALVTSSGFSAASFNLLALMPTSLAIERACNKYHHYLKS